MTNGSKIETIVMTNGSPVARVIRKPKAKPISMPTTPPIRLNARASIRNWLRISLRRAPIDMRIPISRVRSVTQTIMIFMMPIPPTVKRNSGNAYQEICQNLRELLCCLQELCGTDGTKVIRGRHLEFDVAVQGSS